MLWEKIKRRYNHIMIRKLEERDLQQLCELSTETFKGESWNKEQFQSAIKQNFCIGFFDDEKLVSFLIAENLIDDFNILLIATKEEFKNKHIASSLLKTLEDECKILNINKIWLEVKSTNLIAQKFYEKHNFKQIYVRKKYYNNGEDAIILEKKLWKNIKNGIFCHFCCF